MTKPIVDPHYVLRLKHAQGPKTRLWAPNGSGYVDTLEQAGRFAGEAVRAERRYNDGHNALAVPCALVEAIAVKRSNGHVVPLESLRWLTEAAARVAAFHTATTSAAAATRSHDATAQALAIYEKKAQACDPCRGGDHENCEGICDCECTVHESALSERARGEA